VTQTLSPGIRPRVVDDWFYVPARQPAGARRLFCFPHAGGDVTAFARLAALLGPDIELWAVRLPGRGARYGTPLPETFSELVHLVTAAIRPWLSAGSVFYGQSFGALLGYEVAAGLPPHHRPAAVVPASARPPVDWPAVVPADVTGAADLLRMSGLQDEVRRHPELGRLAIAAVRADLDVCETYRHRPGRSLPVPVHAVLGRDDPVLGTADMAGWADCTTAGFALSVVPGGHLLASALHDGPVATLRRVVLGPATPPTHDEEGLTSRDLAD
jgi:surfactin synthase thioesterase subunit